MIAPKPFKKVCKKCGFSKLIAPKSDVAPFAGDILSCPKCGGALSREEANPLEKALVPFLALFQK